MFESIRTQSPFEGHFISGWNGTYHIKAIPLAISFYDFMINRVILKEWRYAYFIDGVDGIWSFLMNVFFRNEMLGLRKDGIVR